MNKIIIGFSDIMAGWMKMKVYDYIEERNREMRISYVQPFFDDLLMSCKFLLSDITGTYELYIDQEGFEATIRFQKYQFETISIEITEDFFEDEIPYNGTQRDWEKWHNEEIIPRHLFYFNVDILNFVKSIIDLIIENKDFYNEGFAECPADKLDEELLQNVILTYETILKLRREEDEEISNS